MKYRLEFISEALEEWQLLDRSIRIQFAKKLEKRLEHPRIVSAKLSGRLKDCYKIKLDASGYRLVYQIRDSEVLVLVIAVGKRDKSAVYEIAKSRMKKAPPH